MNNISSTNAVAFVVFAHFFVSARLPTYFIGIEMFSKYCKIIFSNNTKIICGGRFLRKVPVGGRLNEKG